LSNTCPASLGHFYPDVYICIYFSEKQHCSHTGHINLCELEHLVHILPIKNVSQICDFPWCNLKVAQLCYLLHINSHTECKVQIISVLMHHITSCSFANSQRFASHW